MSKVSAPVVMSESKQVSTKKEFVKRESYVPSEDPVKDFYVLRTANWATRANLVTFITKNPRFILRPVDFYYSAVTSNNDIFSFLCELAQDFTVWHARAFFVCIDNIGKFQSFFKLKLGAKAWEMIQEIENPIDLIINVLDMRGRYLQCLDYLNATCVMTPEQFKLFLIKMTKRFDYNNKLIYTNIMAYLDRCEEGFAGSEYKTIESVRSMIVDCLIDARANRYGVLYNMILKDPVFAITDTAQIEKILGKIYEEMQKPSWIGKGNNYIIVELQKFSTDLTKELVKLNITK